MTKWEFVQFPRRVTTNVCEQFFAFVCQVEWGISPAESAHLLGYRHLRSDDQYAQRQTNKATEDQK